MEMPNEFSPFQLKKVAVSIVKGQPLRLRCDRCESEWKVKDSGLRKPKGYWKCPNGCNAKAPASAILR